MIKGDIVGPPFWGKEGRSYTGSTMVPIEIALVVSYSIVSPLWPLPFSRNLLSNVADLQINMDESFWGKIREEGADRCKPNFSTIWQRHGVVVCKRILFDIFCRLSTMHKRDRQTHFFTRADHGTVTWSQ